MPVAGQSSNRQIDWKVQRLDIQVKKGDTLDTEYEVNYIDAAGLEQPYDFSGSTIKCHIKRNKTDTTWYRIITVSAVENVLSFYIDSEALKIPAGNYQYDIEVEGSDGYHTTIIEGVLIVTQDVTIWTDTQEYNYINILKTIVNYIATPFQKFNPAVLRTQISFIINQFLHFNHTAIFRTSFSKSELPKVTMTNLLKTMWSTLITTAKTYNNVLGTNWSATVTDF